MILCQEQNILNAKNGLHNIILCFYPQRGQKYMLWFQCKLKPHTNLHAISQEGDNQIQLYPHKNTKYPLLTPCISSTKRLGDIFGKEVCRICRNSCHGNFRHASSSHSHTMSFLSDLQWFQRGPGSWDTGQVLLPWYKWEGACRLCLSSVAAVSLVGGLFT